MVTQQSITLTLFSLSVPSWSLFCWGLYRHCCSSVTSFNPELHVLLSHPMSTFGHFYSDPVGFVWVVCSCKYISYLSTLSQSCSVCRYASPNMVVKLYSWTTCATVFKANHSHKEVKHLFLLLLHHWPPQSPLVHLGVRFLVSVVSYLAYLSCNVAQWPTTHLALWWCLHFFFAFMRVSWSSGWPWICGDPVASASCVLGLQGCTTMPAPKPWSFIPCSQVSFQRPDISITLKWGGRQGKDKGSVSSFKIPF